MNTDDIYEGTFQSADFQEKTITIEIDEDFSVKAGRCLIVPTSKLSMQQKTDLLDYLENL